MNKNLSLASALSFGIMTGCSCPYPQYSSKCERVSSSYTSLDFAGEKRLPWELTITHRMKYVGNSWDDRLRFEFTPHSSAEIKGAVIFDLERLTNNQERPYPQESFKGTQIHAERTQYGGTFCNYQYQYQAFAVLKPDEDDLKEVYPEEGEYLYTEPSGMPLDESFNYRDFEPDQEKVKEWYKKIERNGNKIKIDLYLFRNIKDDLSGCDEDSYLPYDPRGKESLKASYHSTELHDEEDPRIGFEELGDKTIPPLDLFKEVISGVQD